MRSLAKRFNFAVVFLGLAALPSMPAVGQILDGDAWQSHWDGSQWQGWSLIGQPGSGRFARDNTALSAVSWGANRLDVFGIGPDGHVWHTSFDGTQWQLAWNDLGQPTSGPLGSLNLPAVSWGPNAWICLPWLSMAMYGIPRLMARNGSCRGTTGVTPVRGDFRGPSLQSRGARIVWTSSVQGWMAMFGTRLGTASGSVGRMAGMTAVSRVLVRFFPLTPCPSSLGGLIAWTYSAGDRMAMSGTRLGTALGSAGRTAGMTAASPAPAHFPILSAYPPSLGGLIAWTYSA